MSEIRSEKILGNVPGVVSVLWSNGRNAVIVFENYRLRSQFYLKLLEPQIRTVAGGLDKPLVYNQEAIEKATKARRLGLDVPVPEPQVEDVATLPEYPSLAAYQAEVDAWTVDPQNWFHKFDIYSDSDFFYLLVDKSDEDGEVEDSLPLRVRLAEGQVVSFQPYVGIKSTHWFGTTNPGLDDEYITAAIERLAVPSEIQALCKGIAAAMSAFDADRERQAKAEREAGWARRDAEERRKLAEEFGIPLPPEEE